MFLNLIFYSALGIGADHVELDSLDTRIPVPLLPHMALHQKQNMREHLESVQGIIDGLNRKDFKAIETAAAKMGFSEEMGKMCERMGAGAPGFTEQALSFHKNADLIAAAARKRDTQAVLISLQNTLSKCTACHAAFRQEIVSEATMKKFLEKKPKNIK